MSTPIRYYTFRADVPLPPGTTLAFTPGQGYWARPDPNRDTAGSGIDQARAASQAAQQGNAAQSGGGQHESGQSASNSGGHAPTGNPETSVGQGAPAQSAASTRPESTASSANAQTHTDWQSILGLYGLPPDVIAELDRIFQTTGDLSQAVTLGQAYIRSTPWYSTTFPGIQAGINAGLFGDEQGYRTYSNQINQLFQQYYGRPATASEISQFVTSGQNASQVAAHLQAQAIQGNINDPLRALFTPEELTAFSNQQAGIDTALGQRIAAEADLAMRVNSLYSDFFGRPVTRDELNGLFQNGATAEDIARQFATQANINAMNPAISHLFTPDEIHEMALSAAGGITQNGQQLRDLADLATQLNSVYHVFTGQGVTREEVAGAYANGLTADEVRNQLEAGTISGSLPEYLTQIFGADNVALVGQQASGASDTAEGRRLQQLMQAAPDYNQLFQQYQGRAVTQDELTALVNAGTSADTVGRQFAGQAFADANRGDIQYAAGAFGEGRLTDAQLTALGQENTGYDTPLGQQLMRSYSQAQQRMHAAFRGVLANPALQLQNGRLSQPGRKPDIGA